MDLTIIIEMIAASVFGAVLYTIIGIAPGTDETAVLAPVTLVLVLTGMEPIVILAFFISAIVAKKLTDSIPVAIAGIPGGVMSAPMVEHAMVLKKHGMPDVSIRKMASGSVIGTIISVPLSLILANMLIPLGDVIAEYSSQIFFGGAVFLALMTKNRWLALISIVPFALLIQGLRHLYWGIGAVPEDTTVFTSFFLGITIGPIILRLFELLNKDIRNSLPRRKTNDIVLRKQKPIKGFPNPFKLLDKQEVGSSAIASVFGVGTFFMSPVGMTIFLGELFSSRIKEPIKKASRAISSMDGVTNAGYIAGTLIPLIAIGLPLSPTAIGPGIALFEAPPVFTEDHNLHHILSMSDFVIATVIGAVIAISLTFFVTIKYSQQICAFVFKYIPHEALLGVFFGLVIMLAYRDAGLINIGGVLLIGLVAGILHRWGVNYGVQFMILYSAPWIVMQLL
ncbi:tripartite tricarboxylate transporter TctA family protein [Virgibacillus profundi]|uniref:Tripartite tricarboxylate transporter TctA family protein n=1 Tax=Virgibacillus profundi TaxID=2024555 RepID=A0A2A2IHD0_9BACI|nr:tripartite tricarboxylate transporter permease [Virgibacillus profundi]PAV30513.1 tripartite tricarboxylate transporter TctA family protein [Virgibacillus profundi]PXY54685.1 tripartite tricarboxylate transporter TctA family protein [Virgibacillus profundi]